MLASICSLTNSVGNNPVTARKGTFVYRMGAIRYPYSYKTLENCRNLIWTCLGTWRKYHVLLF